MRVLILANVVLEPSSGSGKVIFEARRILTEAGYSVELETAATPRLSSLRLGRRFALIASATEMGRRWIRRYNPSLVICFGGEFGPLTYALARKPKRTRPSIVQYSNGVESNAEACQRAFYNDPQYAGKRWYQKIPLSRIYDRAFSHADHVVVVSQFDRDYLIGNGICPPENVTVIENSLPSHMLLRSVKPTRENIVGFCGAWGTRKNVGLIVNDVSSFLRDNPDWRFEAIGPDSDLGVESSMPELVRSGRAAGLGWQQCASSLTDWYERISILVLPSFYESFGLAAAEGLACGCAVVSTRSAGLPLSLAHGREVFLIDGYRSPHLRRALDELAHNDRLRDDIARGGYFAAQRLTSERASAQFREVCAQLLDSRTNRNGN